MKGPKKVTIFSALAVLVLLLINGKALAQTVTLEGMIRDTEGSPLPGATVVAKKVDTGYEYSGISRTNGRYIISGLQAGPYDVTARMPGFTTQIRQGMQFYVGQTLSVDFELASSILQEEVTVVAKAPLIEVTKSDVSSVIEREKIDDLPMLSRSFNQLTLLNTNVQGAERATETAGESGGDAGKVAALPTGSGENLVDGVSNEYQYNATISQNIPADAIQEFRVITGQFEAEYGNAAGMVISSITRSGTNKLEGRVFGFHRDEAFDAKNYFAKEKQAFSQWRYGGNLGGPIIKDKFHFFLAYEGMRHETYSIITTPLNPIPNESVPVNTDNNIFMAKLNYQVNLRNMITLRWLHDSPAITNAGIGGNRTKEVGHNEHSNFNSIGGDWTYYPSGNTMNELKINYVNRDYHMDVLTDPMAYQISRPGGYFGKAYGPQHRLEKRLQFLDDFSILLEKHNIKFGFDLSWMAFDAYVPQGIPGSYTFTTDAPFDPNNPNTYPYYIEVNLNQTGEYKSPLNIYGAFVQDAWKVSQRLTLNVGLRYTYYDYQMSNPEVPMKNIYNFDPRIAVSWDPVGDGKTVVRAGCGKFTQNVAARTIATTSVLNSWYMIHIYYPGYPDPLKPNPFVPATYSLPPKTEYLYEDNIIAPYSLQYSLGFQRQIMEDLSFRVDCLIAQGRHLVSSDLGNPVITGTGNKRVDPTRGAVNIKGDNGRSDYYGVNLNLKKRHSHAWGGEISYTLSSSKADQESWDGSGPSYNADVHPRSVDYGRTSTDARHRIAATGSVDLPLGVRLSAMMYYRSKLPYNIRLGYDANKDGLSADRPDEYLIRNSGVGNDYFTLDARISKFFHFKQFSLQLMAEAFNITNRVNFGSPDGNMRSKTFGKATTAEAPRLIQFGVRFDW